MKITVYKCGLPLKILQNCESTRPPQCHERYNNSNDIANQRTATRPGDFITDLCLHGVYKPRRRCTNIYAETIAYMPCEAIAEENVY